MTVDNNTINQLIVQPGPAENTCLWLEVCVLRPQAVTYGVNRHYCNVTPMHHSELHSLVQ